MLLPPPSRFAGCRSEAQGGLRTGCQRPPPPPPRGARRSQVRDLAKQRLRLEGITATRNADLAPGGQYDGRPVDWALQAFTFYQCHTCRRPYVGGRWVPCTLAGGCLAGVLLALDDCPPWRLTWVDLAPAAAVRRPAPVRRCAPDRHLLL